MQIVSVLEGKLVATKTVISTALLLLLFASQAYAFIDVGSIAREKLVYASFEQIRDSPEELRAFFWPCPRVGTSMAT